MGTEKISEAQDEVKANEWGAAKRTIKTMFLLGLPAYLLPTMLLYALIPPLRGLTLFVLVSQVAIYFTKVKWGIGFKEIPRFIRSQINGNKLHGHSMHRKKSGTTFWCCAFVCVMAAPDAQASYELVLPDENNNERVLSVQSNLTGMPMIERGIVHQGFGHDVPLSNVMSQLIPNSWRINYRDAELASLPISWRSYNLDIIEIFEDISERYGITFRYSNRSGVLHIEWTTEGCQIGKDRAQIYNLIC